MNRLGNVIASLIKWTFIGSFLGLSCFIVYIVQGQERFKEEAAAIDRIEESRIKDSFEIVQLRYLDGDDQARYYLLGMVRATRVMLLSYSDWCPPVLKNKEKSSPDNSLHQVLQRVGDTGYGRPTEEVIVRTMLQINSCGYNDWPELIVQ